MLVEDDGNILNIGMRKPMLDGACVEQLYEKNFHTTKFRVLMTLLTMGEFEILNTGKGKPSIDGATADYNSYKNGLMDELFRKFCRNQNTYF